ncbi:OB-fold nucleic acid binding domain-containing protein [Pedomonas mirosovicensis]|uniref:OB-fold nucleic acid binding domain-containing protein n=1 Tax=Pedomonas mirosovicensis TaxID=2908641 RepID=UPI002169AA01|nr:OB-fold nucleic acid binding domain-containing protein [Pedomonas mirosovicensis]MCH8683715.1 OB-fold nucleic acid binding domain-containing protein [Pedomonas mirosovicensis]
MELLRPRYAGLGIRTCASLQTAVDGVRASVIGVVLAHQRPENAGGVVFLTLEDETGTASIMFWPSVFEKHRAAVMEGRLVRIEGRVQRLEARPGGRGSSGSAVHLVAVRIPDQTPDPKRLTDGQPSPGSGAGPRGEPARPQAAGPPGPRRVPLAGFH